ncbi:hypothetical protein CPB83DRAFT_850209 [Crepidotus variabilis]|uniref:Uncharacterized protein n=1 Tax=Crepidotus variabilis TaxID=179855 RepID=A0A9P6EKW7_9AGAR|nr:hypothetical protein CPB83DRAFT_850209 [Crepidotus variabilis]
MNKTFVFPPAPQPALRPQQRNSGDDGQEGGSRNSNALRASVLDAAMELGLGNSSVVANWMFSNVVEEEDETEDRLLPASSVNSYQRDESTPAPGGHGVHFAPQSTVHIPVGEPGEQQSKPVMFRTSSGPGAALASGKVAGTGQPVAFPEGMPAPPHSSTAGVAFPTREKSSKEEGKKLKKKKSTHDGYESDGGYMSEGAIKKKDKKKKEKEREKEKKHAVENAEDSVMLSPLEPGERKRKKSFVEAMKSSSKKKEKEKTKVKEKDADAGYETDGGTKKPKRSFFKLSGKSSKGDLASLAVPSSSEVPTLPSLGLPIHERFATSMPPNGGSFSSSVAESTVTSTSTGSSSTLPAMVPLAAMTFHDFSSSSSQPAPTSESPTSYHPPPSALTNPHLDLGLNPNRDSQVSTGSSSSAGSASRAAPSSRTSHSSAGKSHEAGGLPPHSGHIIPSPTLDDNAVQTFSPTTSTTSAAPIRSPFDPFSSKPASSPLARSPSPIPPVPAMPNDVLRQPHSAPTLSKPPPSMPPVTPINLDKGAKGGLRIKPSLEKLNLLGRNKEKSREKGFQKDKDEPAFTETLLVPGQTSSALPSPLSPASPYVLVTPTHTSPTTSNSSSQSLPIKPSAPSQYGLPHSPLNLDSTSPILRSRSGQPLSPSDSRAQASQLHVPRTFISAPNTAASSPRSFPTSGPSSATLPVPRSRPTNLHFAPEDDNKLGTGSARPSPLTSPNVLAYYDIPPPSPPPSGPLPIPPREPFVVSPVEGARSPSPNAMTRRARSPIPPSSSGGNSPPVANAVPAQFPTPAQLRQRMMERGPRPPPPSALPQQPIHGTGGGSLSSGSIQRGRESPFPSRRMATVPITGTAGPRTSGIESTTPMRYRELYENESPAYVTPRKSGDKRRARFAQDPVTSGGSAEGGEQNSKRRSWIDFDDVMGRSRSSEDSNDIAIRVSTSDDDDGVSGEGTQESWQSQEIGYAMQDVEDMRDVIDRFVPQNEGSEESAYSGRVIGRSRSFEALDPANAGLSGNTNGDYAWDDKMTVGDRTSRWSGSTYSRVSILDEEESTSRRDQFVRRVEAMLAGGDSKDGTRSNKSGTGGMAGVGARSVGRGMGVFVPPPVPRIPDMYNPAPQRKPPATSAAPVPVGRNWNKF